MKDQITRAPLNHSFIVDETSDACWKSLTETGNMYFKEGNHQLAEDAYEIALSEAEDIFTSALLGAIYLDVSPALMLVSSATNLAKNHFQKGDGTQAFDILSKTVAHLSTALNDPDAPHEFIEECAYYLGYAILRLVTLMRSLGASKESISDEIDKTQNAFLFFSARQTNIKH